MKSSNSVAGHPIRFSEIDADEMNAHGDVLDEIFDAERSGVVVRRALSEDAVRSAVTQLASTALNDAWSSPNRGMEGGEIRVIGDAATPTFTSFGGPTAARYAASTAQIEGWTQTIFGDAHPVPRLQQVFSALFGGRPAAPPAFGPDSTWAPISYRALDPGIQIYPHHDNHFGLQIYENMDPAFDRSTILSWFVTLQPAEQNGNLIVYGLWGSDPDPPMLPSRFLDTEALERDYGRAVLDLGPGDLVIFDSGRHVHRVSPIEGQRPRFTAGGFMTMDQERTRLGFWS